MVWLNLEGQVDPTTAHEQVRRHSAQACHCWVRMQSTAFCSAAYEHSMAGGMTGGQFVSCGVEAECRQFRLRLSKQLGLMRFNHHLWECQAAMPGWQVDLQTLQVMVHCT